MRKRSGANFDELLNKEWSILTKNEQLELQNQYKKTEQRAGGGISFYDMISILRCTFFFTQPPFTTSRTTAKIKSTKTSLISKPESSIWTYSSIMLPKSRRKDNKITEPILPKITNTVINSFTLVDAFVALGGLLDKSGAVTKTTLIETIKREF